MLVVIFQLLNRLLFGSDSSSLGKRPFPESVAYRVLACTTLRSLPFPQTLLDQLDIIINLGQSYLLDTKTEWRNSQYLWIEKVTYGSQVLSESYCLAALLASPAEQRWNRFITHLFLFPPGLTKLSRFFHVAQGEKRELWKYEACVYEGSSFTKKLQGARGEIFPLRQGFKDEYLVYIPAAWTIVNNIRKLNLPASLIWEMMWFSLLDFLVDEYMESNVDLLGVSDRTEIKTWIGTILVPASDRKAIPKKRPLSPKTHSDERDVVYEVMLSQGGQLAKKVLSQYVDEVLQHPKVRTASRYDRDNVRRELHDFLMAHMLQMEDNARLPVGTMLTTLPSPPASFYTWSRSTGSQHISALLSFAFHNCLLSAAQDTKQRQDCFPTPVQKYKASDLSARLAVMSRLFNDWASVNRDLREGNLNSLNFPEFSTDSNDEHGPLAELHAESEEVQALRKSLLQLSEYERQASRLAMTNVLEEIQAYSKAKRAGTNTDTICRAIELFVYVTELFADMYVAKDLTNVAKAGNRPVNNSSENPESVNNGL
jgi:hypothetical protein